MKKNIYVIKDKITEQIEDCFLQVNDGAAAREWTDIAIATKRPHIDDKSLWKVATIDIENMDMQILEATKIDWKKAENPRTEVKTEIKEA